MKLNNTVFSLVNHKHSQRKREEVTGDNKAFRVLPSESLNQVRQKRISFVTSEATPSHIKKKETGSRRQELSSHNGYLSHLRLDVSSYREIGKSDPLVNT